MIGRKNAYFADASKDCLTQHFTETNTERLFYVVIYFRFHYEYKVC